MMRRLLMTTLASLIGILWLWLGMVGCTSALVKDVKGDWTAVEKGLTDGTLTIVTPAGPAHGCAVSYDGRTVILTARHVVDPRPLDRSATVFGIAWSDQLGGEGLAKSIYIDPYRDLAVLEIVRGTPGLVRTLAEAAPKPGDLTWSLGYDFSSRRRAFGPKVSRASVIREFAGCLVLDASAGPGVSGSCVIDAAGAVVAVDAWGISVGFGDRERVGVVVGVWGDWIPSHESQQ